MKRLVEILPLIVFIVLIAGISYASSISFTAPTTLAPQSYTLSDIYNKLNNFSLNTTAGNHTISTTSSPAGTFNNLTEIYEKLSAEDSDLIPSNIKSGVSIFGVAGSLTGAIPTVTWQAEPNLLKSWGDSVTYCNDLVDGGHSDWRLPTIHEFMQITDFGIVGPATRISDFQTNSDYWANDVLVYNQGNAWTWWSYNGFLRTSIKSASYVRVRCVR